MRPDSTPCDTPSLGARPGLGYLQAETAAQGGGDGGRTPPRPPAARQRRRGRTAGRAIEFGVRASGFAALAAIALIFIFVFLEAAPLLFNPDLLPGGPAALLANRPSDDGPQGITQRLSWKPAAADPKFSLAPLVAGTLKITVIALLLAVPLGLGAAIYSAEFAPPRVRQYLKPWIELLAGLPSVVLGFLGLIIIATLLQNTFGFIYRLNATVAGVAVALTTVPLVFTICEDSIRAVPDSIREASLALGATRIQTMVRAVLPAALPGIVGAVLVAFGRAVGETMIVLLVAGNAALLSWLPGVPARTLASTIAAEMGEVGHGDMHYRILFACGCVLFVVTFLTNLAVDMMSARQRALLRRS